MKQAIVQVRDVHKSYATGASSRLDVLRGTSFDVEEGQFVAIVGASGAGKSTLLHIIGALDRPDNGPVLLDGEDMVSMDDQRLAAFRCAGYISGDWDIIKDNGTLYKMSLGPQERFRDRWEANDTSRRADRLRDRKVFIAHAADDRVTPAWQTEALHRDLTRLGTVCRFRIHPRGGHEWAYWDSCLPELFAFFFGNS